MINKIQKVLRGIRDGCVCNIFDDNRNNTEALNNENEKEEVTVDYKREIIKNKKKISNSLHKALSDCSSIDNKLYGISNKLEIDRIEYEDNGRSIQYVYLYMIYGGESKKHTFYNDIRFEFGYKRAISDIANYYIRVELIKLQDLAYKYDCELSWSYALSNLPTLKKYSKDRTSVKEVKFSFMDKDNIKTRLDIVRKSIIDNGVDTNE